MGFDQSSQGGDPSNYGGASPGTPGTGATPWSQLGGGSGQSSRRPTMGTTLEGVETYYRPPRPRKNTLDNLSGPGAKNRGSSGSAELAPAPYADNVDEAETGGEGPSAWSPNRSITPAYLRAHRDDSDPNLAEGRQNVDYSVRESDFYYGLRGPALSAQPTRKLKTGPADPMGPVSSAQSWLKSLGLFGGKKKEKGKGFEVVRSTRIPPQMMPLEEDDESPEMPQEPYRDSPASSGANKSPEQADLAAGGIPRRSDVSSLDDEDDDPFDHRMHRVSDLAPTLGPIDAGGGIELPSRIGSQASRATQRTGRAPTIPRKSSRRTPSTDKAILESSSRLSTVMASPPGTPGHQHLSAHFPDPQQHLHPSAGGLPVRLPFGSTEPSPSPERSPDRSATSSLYRPDNVSDYHALSDDLMAPPSIQGNERPLSTGYVNQHVASETIRNNAYNPSLETSAEFVDNRSRSFSTQHSGASSHHSNTR